MRDQVVEHVHRQGVVALVQHGRAVGRVDDVGRKQTGVGATVGGLDERQVAVLVAVGDAHGQTALGAAVLLAHNHVLRDVHQTTGQVARLCGTQCGIGQTLTSAVLGDEVLQHGQAAAVVRLDRSRNDLALRVVHQTTHAGNLVDLGHVASCTGLDDDREVVLRVEVLLDGLGDFLTALGPHVDDRLAAVLFGVETEVVLLVDLGDFLLGLGDQLVTLRRLDDVGEREGHAGPRCTGEAEILERIQRGGHLGGGVPGGDVVDDLGELLLLGLLVDERVVDGQRLVEEDAAHGGSEQHAAVVEALFLDDVGAARFRIHDGDLAGLPAGRQHEVLRQADQHFGLHVDLVQVERHLRLSV